MCRLEGRDVGSSSSKITIDHLKPQSNYPEFSMDYKNMFGSCRECQEHKRNLDLSIDPKNHGDISQICYDYSDGRIFSTNESINRSLENLKLNTRPLMDFRKSVLDHFRCILGKYRKTLNRNDWNKEKSRLITGEKYLPFMGIVFHYIDGKLNKAANSSNKK